MITREYIVSTVRGVDISERVGAWRIFYGKRYLVTVNFPAACETMAPETQSSYALAGVDRNISGTARLRQEILPIDRKPCLAR